MDLIEDLGLFMADRGIGTDDYWTTREGPILLIWLARPLSKTQMANFRRTSFSLIAVLGKYGVDTLRLLNAFGETLTQFPKNELFANCGIGEIWG